ncbi:MAG: aminotransferase class V-fold PLP-dependent enzyme [Bdellovibrionales bacterium]|nr:aminotransferase class V-fold PLP-dependent enzyme [Bdellovibrionales bacterium]
MFDNFEIPKELIPSDPRFGSGPSLVPTEFLDRLAKTGHNFMGTSHRKPAVKNVVKEIQEGIAKYFNLPADYQVVLGNGGATLLFDMIALGIVEKKSTHYTCGEFSEKWFKSTKLVPWISADQVSVPFGKGINGAAVLGSDLIAVTLNETSTGVQLSALPVVDENTILAVDATSGGGQCPCDVSKVDIFFFAPQKVFASDGGLWIAIMSPKARARATKIAADKTRYVPDIMNWTQAITNSEQNQTYNTPALATLFIMNEQVKRMNELGYDGVKKLSQKKADLLYSWAESKPYLSCYIAEKEFRSIAVATIDVDSKVNVDDVIKRLEKTKTVFGIDGYRKLGRNQFRISMFHNISYEDLEKLTKLLSFMIESKL